MASAVPQAPTRDGPAIGPGILCLQGAVLAGVLLSHPTALIQGSATMQVGQPSPLSRATIRAPVCSQVKCAEENHISFISQLHVCRFQPPQQADLSGSQPLALSLFLPYSNILVSQAFYLKFSISFTHREMSLNPSLKSWCQGLHSGSVAWRCIKPERKQSPALHLLSLTPVLPPGGS